MDFALVKQGEKEPIAQSVHSSFYLRSVHLEAKLDAGTYLVYVRLDRNQGSIEVSLTRKSSLICANFAARIVHKLKNGSYEKCPVY